MLEKELKIYEKNLSEWNKIHSGKFVLIKGDEVAGFFDTFDIALTEAAQKYGLDSYLIRRVTLEQEEIVIPALTLGLLRANIS